MIKQIIKKLYEIYYPEQVKEEVKIPIPYGTIENPKVNEILEPHTQNLYLSDSSFVLTTMKEAKQFTEFSKIQSQNYVAEDHDCDNYSFALNGYWSTSLESYAFGIAWTSQHAFNIMIDDKEQIWICEPQENKWFKLEDKIKDKMYYPFRLVIL